MYQTGGWIATALYMAPPGGAGNFGWGVNFLYQREERRDGNQKDEALRRFNMDSLAASASLQYKFTEILGASFRLAYIDRMLRETDRPVLAPEEGIRFFREEASLSARRSSWDGYLLSEESASVEYAFAQGLTPFLFHSLSLRGVFEKSILPGFRINSRSGLLYQPDVPVLSESGPNNAEVNILPRSFSAHHYAGISLGLEKYLFKFPFGTISALASWQMVYSKGPLLGDQFDYGLMGALFFYMSRLAIPAMGFGTSYNIPANYFQFSFSIGMSL
jgi:hypothetical protein